MLPAVFLIGLSIVFGILSNSHEPKWDEEKTVKIRSYGFKEEGFIPVEYTCDGEDLSPPILWGPLPNGTKSTAIIMEDLDAPKKDFVHWIIYNIPPDINKLTENFSSQKYKGPSIKEGLNDTGEIGYFGPCPPSGTHRYFFKIYVLDAILDFGDDKEITKEKLLKAMEGHILEKNELMGKYKRERAN